MRPSLRPAFTAAALALALCIAFDAAADAFPEAVARLERDLTPVGAERAGNAEGSIPPWTGGLPAAPIDPAVGYVDPLAADSASLRPHAQGGALAAPRL
jgi:hypothetical protein